jgi:hypothetical protein
MKPQLKAITAGVLVALAAPAMAADWEMNPRIEAGYLIDDNYRLALEGSEVDVSGGLLDAQLEWRALTQTSEFTLTPRIRATYFPDESDLDAVDYFANLDWVRRGQRVNSRLARPEGVGNRSKYALRTVSGLWYGKRRK